LKHLKNLKKGAVNTSQKEGMRSGESEITVQEESKTSIKVSESTMKVIEELKKERSPVVPQ
jgi:hypothetical protein